MVAPKFERGVAFIQEIVDALNNYSEKHATSFLFVSEKDFPKHVREACMCVLNYCKEYDGTIRSVLDNRMSMSFQVLDALVHNYGERWDEMAIVSNETGLGNPTNVPFLESEALLLFSTRGDPRMLYDNLFVARETFFKSLTMGFGEEDEVAVLLSDDQICRIIDVYARIGDERREAAHDAIELFAENSYSTYDGRLFFELEKRATLIGSNFGAGDLEAVNEIYSDAIYAMRVLGEVFFNRFPFEHYLTLVEPFVELFPDFK